MELTSEVTKAIHIQYPVHFNTPSPVVKYGGRAKWAIKRLLPVPILVFARTIG